MKKASYIFSIMKQRLHSSEFLDICRINSCDFTRNRCLTCQILVLFILNLLKKSIPKEMISFCEYCNIKEVSRSAVTQARSKLAPQAFIYLNDILIKEFYTDNTFKTFHGLIVMATDGTLLELPINSPDILQRYGFVSNQTETKVPMARASHLYDVINGITVDAIIAPYCTGERNMAIQHFEKIKLSWSTEDLQRILVIFDRGYPSAALIIYLLKHGIKFLMRCNTKFIKEVDDVSKGRKKDVIVNFSAKRTGAAKAELQKLFPNLDIKEEFSIRVVIVTLSTGEKEILLTSLLDREKYPYKIFRAFYFKRWGVEENYKFYKLQLEIENFSGKSCLAVEQDFHATILAANARGVLALEAANEMNGLQANSSDLDQKKYVYEINKKVSMERLKDEFVSILLDPEANIEHFCVKVKNTMKHNLVPIRPGRHFKRIRKHKHRKYHMNLR
jgi:Transposase DDE domain